LKFAQICPKQAKKWQNGQIILFLANSFSKGQMATLPLSVSASFGNFIRMDWGFDFCFVMFQVSIETWLVDDEGCKWKTGLKTTLDIKAFDDGHNRPSTQASAARVAAR